MFALLGILSQTPAAAPPGYTLNTYDNAILADSPLIYFPLTRASFLAANSPSFNNFYVGGSVPIGIAPSASNPVLNGTSNSTLFDVNSTLTIPRSLSSSLNLYQNKTIEVWYQHSNTSGIVFLTDNSAVGNTSQFTFAINYSILGIPGTRVGISRNNGSAWSGIASTGTSLSAGTIYHIVIAWDTTTAYIYINGSLRTSGAWTTISKSTGNISIGRGFTDLNYNVVNTFMSHLAIYNSVLSASQVLAHYNARLT